MLALELIPEISSSNFITSFFEATTLGRMLQSQAMKTLATHLTAFPEKTLTAKTLSPQRIQKRSEEGEIIRLALKSEIIHSSKAGLVFIYRQRQDRNRIRTQTLHLEGVWYLTKSNQLRFRTKSLGRTLRFEGIWKVGRNHELIYLHERRRLKRGVVPFQKLIFRGKWDINSNYRLRYNLESQKDAWEFTGSILRLTSRRGRGQIIYDLGAQYRRSSIRISPSRLTLWGRWRPLSNTELGFEIRISSTNAYWIKLRGSYHFTQKGLIEFTLSYLDQGKQPKASIVLSREIFKKRGEIFLKGETDFAREHFLGAGARWKF